MIRSIVVCLMLCAAVAYGHSGRTDSRGGHRDSRTGKYHYHKTPEVQVQVFNGNRWVDANGIARRKANYKQLQALWNGLTKDEQFAFRKWTRTKEGRRYSK